MVVEIDALRFVVGASFLGWAAASDILTRRVPNRVWVAMGSLGLVALAGQFLVERAQPAAYLVLISMAGVFYPVFYGREPRDEAGWHLAIGHIGAYAAAFTAAVSGWFLLPNPDARVQFLAFLTAAFMVLVFRMFFQARLLRGGADAKALMAVALLVPTYPVLPGLPVVTLDPLLRSAIDLLFPFAFLVLLNAALLFAFTPLVLLAYNASRRHAKIPEAFFGVKVPIDRVPKFAWLMDRIVDGRHHVILMPRTGRGRDAEIAALRDAGFRDVWITPQIPFIVGIAVGFVVSFLIGNILMGVFQAIAA